MGFLSSNQEETLLTGWDAITGTFEALYPNQTPKHYGTLISWKLGGKDPLDGISIYDGGDYWHFVTYGLSELYEKENGNLEYSGYGMEFTLKLRKSSYMEEEGEICNICSILQAIARMTFMNGTLFLPYEYLYSGQAQGIDKENKSNITGFITIPDEKVTEIDTPNGKVRFVELIGATDAELVRILNKKLTVGELYEMLGTDVTDYERKSIY